MHAQTIAAAAWWARPRGEATDTWIANYRRSVKGRQRQAIVKAIGDLHVESVLEVGCHCGPNLVALALAFPELRAMGIDVNKEAIDAGNAWIEDEGLTSRVTLMQAPCPIGLRPLPDGCVDVALSCYALTYIAPSDLDETLYELGRIAARAVVLVEPMGESETRQGTGGYQEWDHDYIERARWIGTLRDRTVTGGVITPPVDRLHGYVVLSRDVVVN